MSTRPPVRHTARTARIRWAWLALTVPPLLAGCPAPDGSDALSVTRPEDVPALHHAGLNSMDPDGAIDWYLRLWPSATRSSFAGRPAVAADMYVVFEEVGDPPSGSFDTALGRPVAQSAFWHIGAFVNTTNMDRDLAAIGVTHLPLYVGPDDEVGVWRSGLAPHTGTLARDQLASAEPAEPRPGGFSYVAGPDGVLFELTGGPGTTPSLSHVHFFHEQPRCAANWYVANLGMAHPPVRGEGGTTSERPNYEPCEGELDPPGWPSLERVGTIREPRATVVHGNGNMSFYPGQCVADRCGVPRSLVPSRGQVLDHVGFVVRDVGAWHAWLTARGVGILEDIHEIPEGRAFMIEGPDRLAIELVEVGTPLLAQTPPAWTEPIEPFRIAEDLYWVGTAGLASYLLTSDQGHVLIDVPLEENVPRVLESIRALGFEPRDVRIVLTSHAHFDHVGGVAGLLEATGAELVVSEADAPFLRSGTDFGLGSRYPAAAPARTVGHLETVRLGDLALTAHLTPGHTPGCTTWSGTVRIDGEPFAWVSACSLSVLSAYRLVGPDATYAGHGADYCRSIAHLRTLDPDVFLSAHGEFFGMAEKRAALLAGDETAFVEREGYHAWVGEALVGIERALAAQGHEGGCAALVG